MSDYQDKDYEEVCILCHRPESKAGRMFHLPNNITVCDDCMHIRNRVCFFVWLGILHPMGCFLFTNHPSLSITLKIANEVIW